MPETDDLDWQIAVFGQNEAARIGACLTSIARASTSLRVLVTLILNGCTDNSAELALKAAEASALPLEIYTIQHADKSNAINRFFYDLRKPARYYCCVDGYATISSGTLIAFANALEKNPQANAASGIALTGRSEPLSTPQTVNVGGVLKGQLYSPTGQFLDRMVRSGVRLPIGLYRGDGLLGSMAAHDLDAIGKPWDNSRVIGVKDATFEIKPLSPFSSRDLKRQFRRMIRQARGRLENAAIKQTIYRSDYASLPEYADAMIADFLKNNPVGTKGIAEGLFTSMALREHSRAVVAAPASLVPTLLGRSANPEEAQRFARPQVTVTS